jgi:hypothetical protein
MHVVVYLSITNNFQYFFDVLAAFSIFAFPKRREFSSAGSEHLPYKQRVTGSNPVTPTKPYRNVRLFLFTTFFTYILIWFH